MRVRIDIFLLTRIDMVNFLLESLHKNVVVFFLCLNNDNIIKFQAQNVVCIPTRQLFFHTLYNIYIYTFTTISFVRFYMKLIICYELYVDKCYEESLLEIENVMKSMECNEFDYEMKRYKYAFAHIAQATYAYVALTLNRDYEKVNLNYCFIKVYTLIKIVFFFFYNIT